MTDVASRDDSENNLAAFELGVYANQFLWNLDQAVVAASEPHRLAALDLIHNLEASGANFTEMRTDAPLQIFLNKSKEHLPGSMSGAYSEWFNDMLHAGPNEEADTSAGESWYSNFGVSKEREKLLKVIVDDTLHSRQQRQWFQLGWLIDSGRHPPDTGNHLYMFDPPRDRCHPAPANPQSILTNDEDPELPPLRGIEPGELRPQIAWWPEVLGLCKGLRVPPISEGPDLKTASSITDTVEQVIARAREMINTPMPDVLTPAKYSPVPPNGLFDGHQQPQSSLQIATSTDVPIKNGKWEFVNGQIRFDGGDWKTLGGKKWSLLIFFLKSRFPVSVATLADAVWGDGTTPETNYVEATICRLRTWLKTTVGSDCPADPLPHVQIYDKVHYELAKDIR